MAVQLNEGAIQALFADPEGPVAQIIEQYAYKVESAAKTLLLIPGSGRVYLPGEYFLKRGSKIYHWTRETEHRASAPGDPPASDTGSLLSSISHQMGVDEMVYATVGSPLKYALYLELGTRFLQPRKFLTPALTIGLSS